ncbi:MAG: hypothetical protein JKY51_04990 [Opitutaceae bacterium]|nr:hypothetical protein [Opitutaceae bacterium]
MVITSKKYISILVSVSLLGFSSSAVADDAAERKKLMNSIKGEMKKVESLLKQVPKDKDARSISRIPASLSEVSKDVVKLAPVSSGDRDAEEIVKKYPSVIKDFNSALGDLKTAKLNQYKLDPVDNVCTKINEDLTEEVDDMVADGDPDDADKIEDAADDMADDVEKLIKDSAKLYQSTDSILRDAKSFSYRKGLWNGPEKLLDSAADAIKDHMKGAIKDIDEVCEPLTDGEKLPYIEEAIEQLEDIDVAAEKFIEDGEKWFEKTRIIFRTSCDAQVKIRKAYCGGDYETGENPDLAAYNKVANSEATFVVKKLIPLLKHQYSGLERRGEKLYDRAKDKEVKRILDNMAKRKRGLDALVKEDHLKGSRSPSIQTWINYGKTMHKSLESKYNCDLNDVAIPGSKKRPDCVSAKRCEILEFKPETPSAVSAGMDQVAGYEAFFTNVIETRVELIMKEKDHDTISIGDVKKAPLLKELYESKCLSRRGNLKMEIDVITYSRCDKTPLSCLEAD